MPTAFSVFSQNSFIANSPLASSEHPCFFGTTTSKTEVNAAKCYVIFGDSTPPHDYNKKPAKIRVERISKDSQIVSAAKLYLSIEDLILPNVDTIHMKAVYYLLISNVKIVKYELEMY